MDDLLTGCVRVLEVDLQSLQAIFSNAPRRTLQRDLQQAVAKGAHRDHRRRCTRRGPLPVLVTLARPLCRNERTRGDTEAARTPPVRFAATLPASGEGHARARGQRPLTLP